MNMGKFKSIISLLFPNMPILFKYCGKQYELRATERKGLILNKVIKDDQKPDITLDI